MIDYGADHEEQEREDAERRAAEYKARVAWELSELLQIYEFRHFLWRLMARSNFFTISYAGENTHQTAFNEGGRRVGAEVWEEVLTADPAIFTLLQREHLARQRADEPTPQTGDDNDD